MVTPSPCCCSLPGGAAGRQRLDTAGSAGDSSGGRLVWGIGCLRHQSLWRLCFSAPEARAASQQCLPVGDCFSCSCLSLSYVIDFVFNI